MESRANPTPLLSMYFEELMKPMNHTLLESSFGTSIGAYCHILSCVVYIIDWHHKNNNIL